MYIPLWSYSETMRRPSQMMKLLLTSFFGVIVGFLMGITFPTLTLTKVRVPLPFVHHVSIPFPFILNLTYDICLHSNGIFYLLVLKWLRWIFHPHCFPPSILHTSRIYTQTYQEKDCLVLGLLPQRAPSSSIPPIAIMTQSLGLLLLVFLYFIWNKMVFNFSELLHIWVPTNPRGAERLPPDIDTPESDLYLRRLWGDPNDVS